MMIGTVTSLFRAGTSRPSFDGCLEVVGSWEPHKLPKSTNTESEATTVLEPDVVWLFESSRGNKTIEYATESTKIGATTIGLDDIDLAGLPIGASLHIGCKVILTVIGGRRQESASMPTERPDGRVLPGRATFVMTRVQYDGEICVGDAVKIVLE